MMIRSVHIYSVVNIYIACTMRVNAAIVIINIQSANSVYIITTIEYVYISNLTYPSVEIIVNGGVFYLNNRSIIIILNIRSVLVSRIKSDANIACMHTSTNTSSVIDIKIEFSIRVYGKRNVIFVKNEGVAIVVIRIMDVGFSKPSSCYKEEKNSYVRCVSHDFYFLSPLKVSFNMKSLFSLLS